MDGEFEEIVTSRDLRNCPSSSASDISLSSTVLKANTVEIAEAHVFTSTNSSLAPILGKEKVAQFHPATVAKTQSGSRTSRSKAPAEPIPKVAEVTRVSLVTLRLECKELKLDFKGGKQELQNRLKLERMRICSIRNLTPSKLISQVTKAGFKDAPSMSRIQLCDILIDKKTFKAPTPEPPLPKKRAARAGPSSPTSSGIKMLCFCNM